MQGGLGRLHAMWAGWSAGQVGRHVTKSQRGGGGSGMGEGARDP